MAAKEGKEIQTQSAQNECDINELRKKHKTPEPIYCGVCTAMNWKTGKMVREEEYDSAVKQFIGSPIGGKG